LVDGAHERLKLLAKEIIEHFEKRREVIEGKAMTVCMSRAICMDLYDEIVALRPKWHADENAAGCVKVIMTGSAVEGERAASRARTKPRRVALARRFKDPKDDER